MISWFRVELWEPMRSPTSQFSSFLPLFDIQPSAIWYPTSSALVPQLPSLELKSYLLISWGSITLSCSLLAMCLPIHPSKTLMAETLLGIHPLFKSNDYFMTLCQYLDTVIPQLTLLPEDTNNCLNQIQTCLMYWVPHPHLHWLPFLEPV